MSDTDLIIIRRIRPADIDALILLIESHANFERASIDVAGLGSKLARELKRRKPRVHIFVAQLNSQLSGFCSLTIDYSTWCGSEFVHMDCLYVETHARGRKLGMRLLEKAVEFAGRRGLHQIQWQTPEWNHQAQQFYKSRGARSSLKRRYSLSV